MAEHQAHSDIGLLGLGVMGQNLVLNMADHGFRVSVYDRVTGKMHRFISEAQDGGQAGDLLQGHEALPEFVASVARPRKIVLLVPAGLATDEAIESLLPHLEKGDIIIDGGNAYWMDTIRREKEVRSRGLHFIGTGISGGEVGARSGPSLMPGGTPEAWQQLRPVWEAIAARVDDEPCVVHIGPDGAGHYVKMVHNGIEYVDMQLICESYFLMKQLLAMTPDEIAAVFAEWNEGVLESYLVEITADILAQADPRAPDRFLVDRILDTAGQKGTGKWAGISALDLGVPANAMAEAVFARFLSALKEERVAASRQLHGPGSLPMGDKATLVECIRTALYCAKICAYAQGFALMAEAQNEFNWQLDPGAIARIWRGGCIIRARFLRRITDAYEQQPGLANLLLDPYFKDAVHSGQDKWRSVVAKAAQHGVAVPAFMSALSYFDSYRSAVLPANLLQAQRDYFGAHTYERIDEPRGRSFHTDWPSDDRPERDVE